MSLSAAFRNTEKQEYNHEAENSCPSDRHGDAVLLSDSELPDKIPNKFSDLHDSHFPLFLSFDQVSLLNANLLKLSSISAL